MSSPVAVAVIDDHPLYRAGVVRTLAEAPDMKVVAEGGSLKDAIEIAERLSPRIMIIDISIPGGGIEAARQIAEHHPECLTVMLTASEADDDILAALAAGARGYVLKGVGAQDLLSVIRSVSGGGSYVSPSLAGRLLTTMQRSQSSPADHDPLQTLSAREEQILRLVAEGKSNKEVGLKLDLQEKTVKHYMTNILQKLQVRNRTEAAILAREGWSKV